MSRVRKQSQDEMLWFISYSDLITAILAVLVMVMSFSKIDIEKFDHANRLMKDDNLVTLPTLEKEYKEILKINSLEELVSILRDDKGLIINMSSTVQFKVGSAELDKKGIALLKPLTDKIIQDSRYRQIKIIGHTDDSGKIESNWELSSKRAYSVLMHLMEHGLEQSHAEIVAYAFNHPLINTENLSEDALKAARSKNRRVTIIIGKSVSQVEDKELKINDNNLSSNKKY